MSSSKKNIVVLVSGSGSNLQSIIDACSADKINGKVVGVISNIEDVYALERADKYNISNKVIAHKSFESRKQFELSLSEEIDAFSPDLVVLAGFMRILSPEFVKHYEGRMLNIHPSLLPKYPGLNTHQRAIDAGDTKHGASVHFVIPELDAGPVILQAHVPIFLEDSAEELSQRVVVQEHMIYPLVTKWFCEDRLELKDGFALLDEVKLPAQGYADD